MSAVTSDTVGATSAADQAAAAAAAADEEEDETIASAATSASNLDIVLRVLSGMCDGQYTDLQVSLIVLYTFCVEQRRRGLKKYEVGNFSTDIPNIPTEKITGAQDFNFALTFFSS